MCSNSKCSRLFDIRNPKFDLTTYLRQGATCPDCGFRAYPARFVMACKDGHLDDFPWDWWVHKGPNNCHGDLKLYSTGLSSTLSEIIIECTKCGKKRTMAGALDKDDFIENGFSVQDIIRIDQNLKMRDVLVRKYILHKEEHQIFIFR